MRTDKILQGLSALLLAATICAPAAAQSWPSRPIRAIAPYPPGGPSDLILRPVAQRLHDALKQPLVVDNRPGAGGNIGASEAARAVPDGHTWLLATDGVVTTNPHVYRKLGFRVEDLMPVMVVTNFSQILVCNPALGVSTLSELVGKARGEQLNYASGGAGVPGHLAMELLLDAAKVRMTHVPYKGPALAMQDVIGGQVPCGFLAGPTVLPQVRAGKLVALAVSGATRSPLAPDVPTVAEAGYPGYDATFSMVLFAPRGTPQPVVEAMHQAFTDALKSQEVAEKIKLSDQQIVGGSSAEAASKLASDSKKWAEVVARINLQLD